jgi:hypothetical protein
LNPTSLRSTRLLRPAIVTTADAVDVMVAAAADVADAVDRAADAAARVAAADAAARVAVAAKAADARSSNLPRLHQQSQPLPQPKLPQPKPRQR